MGQLTANFKIILIIIIMAIDIGIKAHIVIESLFWAYALHITVLLDYTST